MELATRIRARREELKLTQEQLAAEVGVTPQHISRIENSLNDPSLELLIGLSLALGVTTDHLLTGNDQPDFDIRGAIRHTDTLDADAKRLIIELANRLTTN